MSELVVDDLLRDTRVLVCCGSGAVLGGLFGWRASHHKLTERH